MSHSIEAIALLRAVLRDNCTSDLAARRHLNLANQLGVDPLDYCAHRFGLGDTLVGQRVAEWAGLRFATATPSRIPAPRIDRIEHLGWARTLRQTVLGHDLVFVAPRFETALRPREASRETKRALCFTTVAQFASSTNAVIAPLRSSSAIGSLRLTAAARARRSSLSVLLHRTFSAALRNAESRL